MFYSLWTSRKYDERVRADDETADGKTGSFKETIHWPEIAHNAAAAAGRAVSRDCQRADVQLFCN